MKTVKVYAVGHDDEPIAEFLGYEMCLKNSNIEIRKFNGPHVKAIFPGMGYYAISESEDDLSKLKDIVDYIDKIKEKNKEPFISTMLEELKLMIEDKSNQC
jgi:hypothetical protein